LIGLVIRLEQCGQGSQRDIPLRNSDSIQVNTKDNIVGGKNLMHSYFLLLQKWMSIKYLKQLYSMISILSLNQLSFQLQFSLKKVCCGWDFLWKMETHSLENNSKHSGRYERDKGILKRGKKNMRWLFELVLLLGCIVRWWMIEYCSFCVTESIREILWIPQQMVWYQGRRWRR